MKRGVKDFWRKKQYTIAGILVVAAVLGITGIYMVSSNRESKNEVKQEEIAKKQQKASDVAEKDSTEETTEQTTKASAVIEPKPKNNNDTNKEDLKPAEEEDIKEGTSSPEVSKRDESASEEIDDSTSQTSAAAELHFSADTGLQWPINGAVIIDYSMDQTVYFATLDQYKYNPAVVISGNVNDKVQAAANGKILDISTNEETGCTVSMDLGDGYTAIYGQLKEVPYHVGAYLETGDTIGYVSEPTKYYSVEGSNLFFELKKDDVPVDPEDFFR